MVKAEYLEVMEPTIQFESKGNPSAFNPNDAGNGVSFGLIQFNQKVGGLFQLLCAMRKKSRENFDAIFGSHLMTGESEQKFRDITYTNLSGMKSAFIALGKIPEFTEVQYQCAVDMYLLKAIELFRREGYSSKRQLAAIFDSCVQNGAGNTSLFLKHTDKFEDFVAEADSNKYAGGRRTYILHLPDAKWNERFVDPKDPNQLLPEEIQAVLDNLGLQTVKQFQRLHGLERDGIIGPETHKKLRLHHYEPFGENDTSLTEEVEFEIASLQDELKRYSTSSPITDELVLRCYLAAFKRVAHSFDDKESN